LTTPTTPESSSAANTYRPSALLWTLTTTPSQLQHDAIGSFTPALTLPPDAQATAFYLHHFVGDWAEINDAIIGALPKNGQESLEQSPLSNAMMSVGLANLGTANNSPHMVREAWRRYMQALRLTQMALEDPVLVKSNDTFLAIFILTHFEVGFGSIIMSSQSPR
jgi:hypothetical protein